MRLTRTGIDALDRVSVRRYIDPVPALLLHRAEVLFGGRCALEIAIRRGVYKALSHDGAFAFVESN